jgi:large subunit ribosomal protein L38e
MPVEIFDREEFIELSKTAEECRIKHSRDNTKLKLRTKKYLYTIKIKTEEAQNIISKLNCQTVEV